MDKIGLVYRLEEGSVVPLERNLGANIEKVQLDDGSPAWVTMSVDYMKAAITQVQSDLKEDNVSLKMVYGKGSQPYLVDYRPEIDISKELGSKLTNRCQQLIGTLRWAIEIGRLDILTEVSSLLQHLCNPRIGHLHVIYSIFNYLRCNMNKILGRIVFDPRQVVTDRKIFDNAGSSMKQCQDFYPDGEELMPRNMSEPLGKSVRMRTYVDANNTRNLANRRLLTGIIIYQQCTNNMVSSP